MALIPAPLASGLEALVPTDQVSDAIARIGQAFDDYFQGASVSGITPVPGSTAAARSAMEGAMSGLNAPNGAATAIAAGITQYWTALGPLIATVWIVPGFTVVPASLVPPPGLGGLQAAIQGAFDANVAAEATLSAAANQVATAIHGTQSGGTVTLQPIAPGPPVVTPIL